MATIKTYGVTGLMEWEALIPSGKTTLSIQFTGGTLTGYGVTPALYSTENPVFQQIIEHSEHFRSGRIKLIRAVETADPPRASRPVAASPKESPKASPEASPVLVTAEPVGGDGGGDVRRIEVTDRSMAKNYMMENYGLSANTLRTRSEIERAAKVRGIEFVGLE